MVGTQVGTEVGQVGELLQALQLQIKEVPFLDLGELRLERGDEDQGLDFRAELRVPGGGAQLLIGEVKPVGEPRFARAAADQLFRLIHQRYPGAYGMLLAPYISPQAAAICEAN